MCVADAVVAAPRTNTAAVAAKINFIAEAPYAAVRAALKDLRVETAKVPDPPT